jgi:ubiquinone/menaquinone biosynthesis C-methylase UbiE
MNNKKQICLPGLNKQFDSLMKNLQVNPKTVLVIGSGSENAAALITNHFSCSTELIVQDYESLMNSRINLDNDSNIKICLMNYEVTDFAPESFDLIYAQASVSLINRNKIIKEIKRILKPDGYLCIGEIVSLKQDIPLFVRDIFDSAGLLPLFVDDLEKYYTERKFNLISLQDFSNTLAEYYTLYASLLKSTKENLTDNEKSYYKKLLNKIHHESNVYLKLGGDKFIGFVSLLLQKGIN